MTDCWKSSQIIACDNRDWPSLGRNLKRACAKWGMSSRLLEKNGVSKKAKGMFHKAVAQLIPLCGSETWVVTGGVMKVLEGFHRRCAHKMTGLGPQRQADGEQFHPPAKEELRQAGSHPICECVRRRQAATLEQIATHLIHQLCLASTRCRGSMHQLWWWQQDHSTPAAEAGDEVASVADSMPS